MKSIMRWTCFFVLVVPAACAPLPQFPFAADADLAPPRIVSMGFRGPSQLFVGFNEACSLVDGSLIPGATLKNNTIDVGWDPEAHELNLAFSQSPSAGTEHVVEAQVADPTGNQLRFVAKFFGLNPLLPEMIINEFTTQGSGSHPDFVEIRVLTDGNLAGSCIYEGVPGNWDSRYVFPDVDVRAGDYLVVHFKPEGIAEEVDELLDPGLSGGRDAAPEAWDFWVPDGNGLSGNNGAITLCENPVGGIIDAVLYSNRNSQSDERYRGFGSRKVMEQADYLFEHGAWIGSDPLRPEDAVDPEDSTATRSVCRASDGKDSNARDDWHITPTRGLTPGRTNSDEVYAAN